MQRRDLVRIATIALGGMVHTPALAALLKTKNRHLINAPDFIAQAVDVFSLQQRGLVASIAETIIPATELPGALEADVPRFIEILAGNWMTAAERTAFTEGLATVEALSREREHRAFSRCDPAQRKLLLEWIEEQHRDHAWYQPSYAGDIGGDIPFIAQIKELTVFGFFMSEVGCRRVLRYNPMPGRFEADIPLVQGESGWTPTPLM